jgi:hypothetical protein
MYVKNRSRFMIRYHHYSFFKIQNISKSGSPEFVKQPYTNSIRFASALAGFFKSINSPTCVISWQGKAVRNHNKHRIKRNPCWY